MFIAYVMTFHALFTQFSKVIVITEYGTRKNQKSFFLSGEYIKWKVYLFVKSSNLFIDKARSVVGIIKKLV